MLHIQLQLIVKLGSPFHWDFENDLLLVIDHLYSFTNWRGKYK